MEPAAGERDGLAPSVVVNRRCHAQRARLAWRVLADAIRGHETSVGPHARTPFANCVCSAKAALGIPTHV